MSETRRTDKAYFDRVGRAWDALPELEADAPLREEIRASWARCIAAGLTCGEAQRNIRALCPSARSEADRKTLRTKIGRSPELTALMVQHGGPGTTA